MPKELSGILNWALEGRALLQTRGDFPEGMDAGDLREEWKRRSDSLYWFVTERVSADPASFTTKADFNEAYATFCEEHSVAKKSPEVVGKHLPALVPQIRTARKRMAGIQRWGWSGIRLVSMAGETAPDGTIKGGQTDGLAAPQEGQERDTKSHPKAPTRTEPE